MQAAQLAADADALLEPEEPPAACLPRILSGKDQHVRSAVSHMALGQCMQQAGWVLAFMQLHCMNRMTAVLRKAAVGAHAVEDVRAAHAAGGGVVTQRNVLAQGSASTAAAACSAGGRARPRIQLGTLFSNLHRAVAEFAIFEQQLRGCKRRQSPMPCCCA
jgi:hypothetical protein